MKEQLEDFVRRNRPEFDDREPSSRVWKRIENALGLQDDPRRWSLILWRAAAIFFMMLSIYLFIPRQVARVENDLTMKEFSDVEAFYIQQISNKVDLIAEFNNSDGVNGFTRDFQQLEAMYLVLKEEMKSRPSEKVKDALVLNLLVRIDLLNQQLHRLEEKKEADDGKPRIKEERST